MSTSMSMNGESEMGKKRRLPVWMSSAKESYSSIIDEQPKPKAILPKGKLKGKGKGRKTISQEEEEEEEEEDREIGLPLPLPLNNKRRIKKQLEKPKRPRQQVVIEDDVEDLTVDDLITIAQEYVKADAGKDCDEGITTEPEPRKQSLATSLTSRDDSGRSIIGNDVLPSHTSLDLFLKPDQTKSRDQQHSVSKEIIHNSSRTGDPAQDMLDLFLGPLLQKPQTTKEIRREAVREEIELDIDSQIQSQREGFGKQVPTLGKKKTSLKDKVAMLLD